MSGGGSAFDVVFAMKTSRFLRELTRNPAIAAKAASEIRPFVPTVAQALLDDGILLDIESGRAGRGVRKRVLDCESYLERQEIVAAVTVITRRLAKRRSICEKCLYLTDRCICEQVTRFKSKHQLWLYQHPGEFARGNNSGHLLCLMGGAKRVFTGIREEVGHMENVLTRERDSSVVLFPTESALTLKQYQEWRRREWGEKVLDKPLNIVLLDGTSGQAKSMENRFLQFIPRLKLNASLLESWLTPIRPQTTSGRVCTAQAAAIILKELGEEGPYGCIRDAVRTVVRHREEDNSK